MSEAHKSKFDCATIHKTNFALKDYRAVGLDGDKFLRLRGAMVAHPIPTKVAQTL